MIRAIAIFGLLMFTQVVFGQYEQPTDGVVFVDSEVPRVDITIDQNYLDLILHPDSLESNVEYPAQFKFASSSTSEEMDSVGFRLRGNTSRFSGKKSFKISFNTFNSGRKFYGLEKMNLNGEHNDPSIIRAKLGWNIFKQLGIPSSRSNHVEFYVNGEYKGLYINVEHIDEEFIKKRMSDASGNLWKCLWPADLHYRGEDPDLYGEPESWGRRAYQLKTNEAEFDYSDLAHFIDVLNNYSDEDFKCELERIFDVPNYLKVMALDMLTGNWDGPIVNKNNFYLYHNPSTNKITYIPYDLDNTYGIDWFNVDWVSTSIYSWSSYSGEYRPLYENIMAVPEWKDLYSFYLENILETQFSYSNQLAYINNKLDLIKTYRPDDVYASYDYGYTYQNFLASYDTGLGAHIAIGLKDYILERGQTATSQLNLKEIAPAIVDFKTNWTPELVRFEFEAVDDGQIVEAKFHFNLEGGTWEEEIVTLSVDNKGSVEIPFTSVGILTYYLELLDDQGMVSNYPRCKDGEIKMGFDPVPYLVINEFMASNLNKAEDEFGEFDDWIEIYNPSDEVIILENLFFSDDPANPGKWQLPADIIFPDSYAIFWADKDPEQGPYHMNFKLNKSGETIGLYDGSVNNYAPIDVFTYQEEAENKSYSRQPNGVGDFVFGVGITHNYNNDLPSPTFESVGTETRIWPNPVNDILYIRSESGSPRKLIDLNGRLIIESSSNAIDVSNLESGIYILSLNTRANGKEQFKIMID